MTESYPKQEPPYGLRMPPELKARIKSAAASNNRSMNAEIVATLEEAYPDPQSDLELATLAAWLSYVETGGPEDEMDDRLYEVNDRLAKHPATAHLRLGILVTETGEDIQASVILTKKRAEDE